MCSGGFSGERPATESCLASTIRSSTRSARPSLKTAREAIRSCREKASYITKVIRNEEENFLRTLDSGMRIFGEMLEMHKEHGQTVFSGSDAFKLYDTYGFPIDLTTEMIEDEGMSVDLHAFQDLMEEQKQRARKAREALGDLAWSGIDLGLDNTPTQFTGYEQNESAGRVLAIVVGDELQSYIGEGQNGIVVLDKTPSYAEMGARSPTTAPLLWAKTVSS